MTTRANRRIAPPTLLARELVRAFEIIERAELDEQRREAWYNAARNAFNYLFDGIRFERLDDGSINFPSRSRGSAKQHNVNGACTCEAATEKLIPCWHRPGKGMIDGAERAMFTAPVAPPPVEQPAYHCPKCAAPLHLRQEDDPALDVYMCCNPRCSFQMSRDWFELYAEAPQPQEAQPC